MTCPICGSEIIIGIEQTILGKLLIEKCTKCRWKGANEFILEKEAE